MVHIGIDLGTTNSVVAYVEDGEAEIVENSARGEDTTPSAVMIDHDGGESPEVTVGGPALSKRVTEPEKIVTRAKDHMGETDENGEPVMLTADGEEYRPEKVSSYILESLIRDANDKVDDIGGVVVTVPYYFNEQSRQATRRAFELIDFEALDIEDIQLDRLMNEPTAAVQAYALEDEEFTGTALVYDLGGGTFDATLVEVAEDYTEVLGTIGRRDLGGENFDDELYGYVRDEIVDQGLMDPDEDPRIEQQVRETVVERKEDLAKMNATTFDLLLGTDSFRMELDHENFENVTGHLVEETLDALDELFDDDEVDVAQGDVDEVILVGGSTRIPLVEQEVESYFGFDVNKSISPDKAVGIGAAVEAQRYDGNKTIGPGPDPNPTIDVLSHSLGVEAYEEGAGEDDDPIFDPILERNQSVPHEETEVYQTMYDDQTEIASRILQGEGEMADDPENEELATFTLTDIEPRPANQTRIDVTFTVDDQGMLEAEAEDRESGEKVTIELDDPLSMDEEELEGEKRNRGSLRRPGDEQEN